MENRKLLPDPRFHKLLSHHFEKGEKKQTTYASDLLIIGANTPIGVYTLHSVLKNWPNRIHLLVNSPSVDEARDKIGNLLVEHDLDFYGFERIEFHLGQPSEEQWGLNNLEWIELKENVGHVLHLSHSFNYKNSFGFYDKLWLPELKAIVEYCADANYPKKLHYDSTYATNFLREDKDFEKIGKSVWRDSYTAFKWIARKYVTNAIESKHIEGSIYDIPMLLGTMKKGLSPSCYSAWEVVDIFIKSGFYVPFSLRISSVDVVSKMIATNICNGLFQKEKRLIRPILPNIISHWQLSKYANRFLDSGLREGSVEDMLRNYPDENKILALLPSDYKELLNLAKYVEPIYPENDNEFVLPDARDIFLKNLQFIFGKKQAPPIYSN